MGTAEPAPDAQRTLRTASPLDAWGTLAPLRRGPYDPSFRLVADRTLWRCSAMKTGSVTVHLVQTGPCEVLCDAWGPGADEAATQLPGLLGADADLSAFDPRTALVRRAAQRHPGVRIPRTTRIVEALVPAALEQRVQGVEAFASWRRLVRAHGAPAPGPVPAPMFVPPSAQAWAAIPSWEWHRAGVDPGRARTAVVGARHERQLQGVVDDRATAYARLRSLPGIGAWTAAEIGARALGDLDAVSVGDYHLAKAIGWTLVGEPVDDAAMLEILEPWRPHRGLVIRLLAADGALHKPRFGPRLPRQDHRTH